MEGKRLLGRSTKLCAMVIGKCFSSGLQAILQVVVTSLLSVGYSCQVRQAELPHLVKAEPACHRSCPLTFMSSFSVLPTFFFSSSSSEITATVNCLKNQVQVSFFHSPLDLGHLATRQLPRNKQGRSNSHEPHFIRFSQLKVSHPTSLQHLCRPSCRVSKLIPH